MTVEPMDQNETRASLDLDAGGVWLVLTASGSSYLFDLDRRTVKRQRGVGAPPTINDRERPLHEMRHCAVGQQGYWTMEQDGLALDAYWQISSLIVRIERVRAV